MKIARYLTSGTQERLGVVTRQGGHDMLLDVARAGAARAKSGASSSALPSSVMDLIEGQDKSMDEVRGLINWAASRLDPMWLDDPDTVRWLTPVPPKSMICAGRNFGKHKLESVTGNPAGTTTVHSDFPTGFIKLGRTLVPHRSRVARPKGVIKFDYEVEVAMVIGRAIDSSNADTAERAIFGYTVLNDLSAREIQRKEMDNGMMMLGKNFPGFGPLGPYILTADEVPDPGALNLSLKVNGELRQRSDCRDLIFGFAEMVAFWSQAGLVPGDLISTGTPSGIALYMKPDPLPFFLKPGDFVEAGVDQIGVLETYIV